MRIGLTIDDLSAREGLSKMAARGENLHPLMLDIGEEMHRSVEKNFADKGRPNPWPLSVRAKRDGGLTLTNTARLRRSMTVDAGTARVRIGTNVKYAAIHQFGGKTKPHIIEARKKGGLWWPGARHPVRSVNHPGSNIPARPFLVLPDDDQRRVEHLAVTYMGGKS